MNRLYNRFFITFYVKINTNILLIINIDIKILIEYLKLIIVY